MFLKRVGNLIVDLVEVSVFSVAIFLFVYLLILQPHKIKGGSMEPNFHDGDYLLTDKVSYRFKEPQRGDVIVFKAPNENGEEFIKRIIALPGETVRIFEGKVYVNNERLSEYYLPNGIVTNSGSYISEGEVREVLPDQFFVLGDNRLFSSDSRSWGFVPKKNITGKAWFIYWPYDKIGTISHVSYSI